MPPVRMRGDGRMAKNPKKTLLRLLGYMRKYLPILVVVLVCIFLTSFAQTMAPWWTTISCPWSPAAPRTTLPWPGSC